MIISNYRLACEERIRRKIQDIRFGCNWEGERRKQFAIGLINTSESIRAGFCLPCMEMSYDKFYILYMSFVLNHIVYC